MSLGGGSGNAWTESESGAPWEQQQRFLVNATGNKDSALFDSAYRMWDLTKTDDKVQMGRPHVFGERDASQADFGSSDFRSSFVDDARSGNLDSNYISTTADFMKPQTDAQNQTLDLAGDMSSRYTNADGTIDNSSGLGYLLPQAFGNTYDVLLGKEKISAPTVKTASMGSLSNMNPATVGNYSGMSAAQIGSLNKNIGNTVGSLSSMSSYNPSFGYDDYLSKFARGDYTNVDSGGNLTSNPYAKGISDSVMDRLTKNYTEKVLPQWDTYANAAGRYGSSSWETQRKEYEDDFAKNAGKGMAEAYAPYYSQDMERVLQAIGQGSQQSQFEDTLTTDINRYNTDIQNRKAFEEAGYRYGGDTTLAQLEADRLGQNAGFSQEANRMAGDTSFQKALQDAGWSQEASAYNAQQAYNKAFQNAQFQNQTNQLQPEYDYNTDVGNIANRMAAAQYAPDLAMRSFDPISQTAAVGDIQQQQAQKELDAAVTQSEFLESIPTNALNQYASMISGNYGAQRLTQRDDEGGK